MSHLRTSLLLPLFAALALSGGLAACAKDTPDASPGSPSSVGGVSTPGDPASPGATGSPTDAGSPAGNGSPSATDTASPSDPSSLSASAAPSDPSAPTDAPVAAKSLRMGGDAYTLSIHAPRRQDQTVTLAFDLSIDETSDQTIDAKVLSSADSPLSHAGGVPNGLSLVDTAAQKMYLPATTGDTMDTALCTPAIPNPVKKGDVYTFSCVYAGVPQNLSTVTVRSDSFGSFDHVAIR